MNASERHLLLVTAAVLVLGTVGCGASLSGPGTGTGGSTGIGGIVGTGGIGGSGGELATGGSGPFGTGGGPAACLKPAAGEVPSEHRVSATACSPTQNQPPPSDGGVASCATSADCGTDASYTFYSTCLHGQCSFDACLTDADCGPNSVCACSTDYYGGNGAYHPNVCVPANCHADSDCGVGGYCSPSRGYCGSFQGFYCHTPSDTCINATSDCQSCGENACIYSPAVGAFTCGTSICAG
jgi:hypothetical protein